MRVEISKIDAAVHQLDWAIVLFVDHGEFIPAITLASAAEEILGKAVGTASVSNTIRGTFSAQFGMKESEVTRDHLNRFRNWLKHWDEYPNDDKLEVEADKEAVQSIARALANLAKLDKSLPSQGPKFLTWLDAHPEMRNP